jgi:glycosyltransferase involved in cell wall biosynthesis
MKRPLVSVITVVFNNKDGIEKTLKSIEGQRYAAIEYIIIDGGSTDGTQDVIRRYSSVVNTFISEPDQGIYDAMNKGLKLAKGELAGILNSGDHYEPDTIETVVQAYEDNPYAAVFHGILRVFNASGEFKSVIGNHSSFLTTGMIEHPTCFVKRELYNDYGYFSPIYLSSSDYEWMLRMRKYGVKFYFIEKILANYYTGGISFQTNALLETLMIRERYGFISGWRRLILTCVIKLKARIETLG